MDDSADQTTIDSTTPKVGAPKDKSCPYCGQAFTSSSLGRHLDLYIKEKNPKPPDGIHNVDEIRKMRGGITRRQARASLGGRRERSTPGGTPRGPSRKASMAQESDGLRSPAIPREGQYAVDTTLSKFHFNHPWEATGVINDLPGKAAWDGEATPESSNRRPGIPRTASRQVAQKAQLDVKQKVADAMDTARAAELALRELLSSWRAVKQQIDNNSMPFDFDPLSLDFPTLTLQCLRPPPTLFSSTQHPTSTSWSVQSPGRRELDALKVFFQEEFRSWKVTCATATTASMEDLTYPPSGAPQRDIKEAVKKAEKSADNLEKQVTEHLQSAYSVWEALPAQRRHELWILELARGVGRKDKEMEALKDQQHKLKQENANLKIQLDQLNRLQQPREFKVLPPSTIPFDRDLVTYAYEQGVKGGKGVGFSIEDRHVDLASLVTKSIERWKNVITSTRASASGMNAQKSLDQSAPSLTSGGGSNPSPTTQSQTRASQATQRPQPPKRQSTTSTTGQTSEQTSASTTGPPSVEETSDQDADADMEDDDSFAIVNTSPLKGGPMAMQQHPTLEVPRTRGHMQQRGAPDPRFVMQNGHGSPAARAAMNMSRSMPNMNMAMQGNSLAGSDMGMTMQGVGTDTMYLE